MMYQPASGDFGLLAGASTQFIQCGEYRSAVKVSTCNNLPPPQFGGVWCGVGRGKAAAALCSCKGVAQLVHAEARLYARSS
jgi:hypothetical protein